MDSRGATARFLITAILVPAFWKEVMLLLLIVVDVACCHACSEYLHNFPQQALAFLCFGYRHVSIYYIGTCIWFLLYGCGYI